MYDVIVTALEKTPAGYVRGPVLHGDTRAKVMRFAEHLVCEVLVEGKPIPFKIVREDGESMGFLFERVRCV